MATISSSETFAKRLAIFLPVRKTVNVQGYSKLLEPIKRTKIAIHRFGKYKCLIYQMSQLEYGTVITKLLIQNLVV